MTILRTLAEPPGLRGAGGGVTGVGWGGRGNCFFFQVIFDPILWHLLFHFFHLLFWRFIEFLASMFRWLIGFDILPLTRDELKPWKLRPLFYRDLTSLFNQQLLHNWNGVSFWWQFLLPDPADLSSDPGSPVKFSEEKKSILPWLIERGNTEALIFKSIQKAIKNSS